MRFVPPLRPQSRRYPLLLVPVALIALLAAPGCTDDGEDEDGTVAATQAPAEGETTGDTATPTGTTDAGASADGSASTDASVLTGAVRRVVEDARPSVVHITNQQALSEAAPGTPGVPGAPAAPGAPQDDPLVPAGVGSGVFIDDEGHILTNNHVIAGAESVLVRLTDGREFEAEVVGRDPRTDLAVLHVEGDDLPVAGIGASGELVVGEWVVAIGNALGLVGGPTVTVGVVSAVGRTVQEPGVDGTGGSFLFDVIQTDAAINPGNSGGPLLNLDAEVVGINTLGAGSAGQVPVQGISFAIAIDTAMPLAEEMIETGTVAHPYLGISYIPLNPAISSQLGTSVSEGAVIGQVEPGSPAEEAGLEPDDIIVEINGEALEGESDLPAALNGLDVGDEVELVVLRGDEEVTVTATLVEAPPPPDQP